MSEESSEVGNNIEQVKSSLNIGHELLKISDNVISISEATLNIIDITLQGFAKESIKEVTNIEWGDRKGVAIGIAEIEENMWNISELKSALFWLSVLPVINETVGISDEMVLVLV